MAIRTSGVGWVHLPGCTMGARYNEAEQLMPMQRRLAAILSNSSLPYEIDEEGGLLHI